MSSPARRGSLLAVLVAALAVHPSLAATVPAAARDGATSTDESRISLVDPGFLHQYATTYAFRLGRPTSIQPAPDGKSVLFLRSGPTSFVQDLYEFDVASGRERVLLTTERILRGGQERVTAEERARRERLRSAARGIASFSISDDGRRLLVPLSGRLFVIERASGAVRELHGAAAAAEDPRFSPDGGQVACVRDGDLYVTDLAAGDERRLTTHESPDISYGSPEFVAQEEMDRFTGYWWSPDSRWIACQRTDVKNVERLHILDPAHPEQPPQAWAYPRPGKANAEVTLQILPAAGGSARSVSWDRGRWPYLARVSWEGRAPLTLLVQNRAQTEEAILTVEPATGQTRVLLVERDAVWLNLDGEMPCWLEDGSAFLWSSERSGAWQLELRGADGRLVRTLTPATLGYRELLHADGAGGVAWVLAGSEPTERHPYRLRLDGRGTPERIGTDPGVHDPVFGKSHDLWVDVGESPGGSRYATVRHVDGSVAGELRSVAETPREQVRFEPLTVGPRHLRAAVVRPADFDRGRRYPVVLSVYAGPHAQQVLARASTYQLDQWLANQGFIVVRVDGRGTPARGRAWERVLKGDLISIPLADQIEGLRAVAKQVPQMDLSRVGVWGGSFGGYFTAMAVLRRPDVFAAGFSDAPVVDWHDYDTHYTERYLGMPGRDSLAYRRSSVLTYAHDLRRPLLLVHGTADDNVYFFHSLKLVDALMRAGTPADLWPIVGRAHGARESLLLERVDERVARFFRHELGAPR